MNTLVPAKEEQATIRELCTETKEQLLQLGLEVRNDNYVVWQKDNPAHPRNWTAKRKAYDFGLIVFFDLFALVSRAPWLDTQADRRLA